MIFASDHGSRPVGTPSRISWFITVCWTFDLVSIVGDSPVTVIDSLTLPTSSLPLTVATNAALIRMSDWMTVLKPWSSNFTAYVPGERRSNRYTPELSVTTDESPPMSRSPLTVTVAPGSTALLESVTVPVIDPVCTWAYADTAGSRQSPQSTSR